MCFHLVTRVVTQSLLPETWTKLVMILSEWMQWKKACSIHNTACIGSYRGVKKYLSFMVQNEQQNINIDQLKSAFQDDRKASINWTWALMHRCSSQYFLQLPTWAKILAAILHQQYDSHLHRQKTRQQSFISSCLHRQNIQQQFFVSLYYSHLQR